MSRHARAGGGSGDASLSSTEQLLDIRYRLAEARDVTAATWLACASPLVSREIAAALGAVTNLARSQLDDVLDALDEVIASRDDGRDPP